MTITRPNIDVINSLFAAKYIDLSFLIEYSTYFKDVIHYYVLLSIQSDVRLIEVFNNRKYSQIQSILYMTLISGPGSVFA